MEEEGALAVAAGRIEQIREHIRQKPLIDPHVAKRRKIRRQPAVELFLRIARNLKDLAEPVEKALEVYHALRNAHLDATDRTLRANLEEILNELSRNLVSGQLRKPGRYSTG